MIFPQEIVAAIVAEREHQGVKYGPADRLSLGGYLVVLQGELDEAFRHFQRAEWDEAKKEVLQVAAVAVACMEAHGVHER